MQYLHCSFCNLLHYADGLMLHLFTRAVMTCVGWLLKVIWYRNYDYWRPVLSCVWKWSWNYQRYDISLMNITGILGTCSPATTKCIITFTLFHNIIFFDATACAFVKKLFALLCFILYAIILGLCCAFLEKGVIFIITQESLFLV